MCLAVPGKIIKLEENKAIVEVGKMKRQVFICLVPEVEIGNYVLVHAGCAIEIIDEKEAMLTLEIIKELAYHEIC